MRTLILLDLDNVLQTSEESDQQKLPAEWRLPDSGKTGMKRYAQSSSTPTHPAVFVQEGQAELPENGAVVVIAFNQETARARSKVPLTPQYLLRLAEATAAQVGSKGKVRCEAIPVLTVPQASDAALLQALRRAPTKVTVGPFGRVVVVSGDRGLVESAGALLTSARKDESRAQHGKSKSPFPWVSFNFTTEAFRRVPPAAPTHPASTAQPLVGWSARVTNDQHIAALMGRSLDWSTIGDFSKFAEKLHRRVELLSQLGPTRTSQRGVARLGACLNVGSVPLLPASTDDGIEIEGTTAVRGRVSSVSEAFVDEGAVRIDDFNATLRARLPRAVIKHAAQKNGLTLDPNSNLTDSALSAWRTPSALIDLPALKVDLRKTKDRRLLCTVRTSEGRMPSGWWFFETSAKDRLKGELPREFSVPDSPGVSGVLYVGRTLRNVDIAAPPVAEVPVKSCGPGWQIVSARQDEVMVLVLLSPQQAALASNPTRFKVRRIQEVEPPANFPCFPDRTFWYFLRRLPVLVPCQL